MHTVRDVARLLHVSESAVYALIDSGQLACHRIGNGRGVIRISGDDLDRYLGTCRVEKARKGGKPVRVSRRSLKHIQL